jgi:anthranilate synthase/aminodeoxychorismate synthase-like glutamine amidotransferase
MILMIDNYDSFTYNLVQVFQELGQTVRVRRNDAVRMDEIERRKPDYIVVSPGPGRPEAAGVSLEVIRRFAGRVPILGVCLGHQAIGAAFGARVVQARRLMHGKVSSIRHDGKRIFRGIENPFRATRYHSLAVAREGLPDCLAVTAWSEDGEIMALRHRRHSLEGVQFHPESILTSCGRQILENFLTCYAPPRS